VILYGGKQQEEKRKKGKRGGGGKRNKYGEELYTFAEGEFGKKRKRKGRGDFHGAKGERRRNFHT